MSTWNIVTYPVSNLDMTAADITHTFVNYIVGKMPEGTFKKGTVFVDTMGLVNDHKRRDTGLENPKTIYKPILTVNINGGLTDPWSKDDGGPEVKQYSMFPGTTTDRNLVNNHRLGMINDRRVGLIVDTIEIRRKLELDFKIEFDSKGDLNTMKSYIYNVLPLKTANYLDNIKTNIILPNSLVNDISRIIFKRDEFNLIDEDNLNKLRDYMNEKGFFDFYYRNRSNNTESVWFLMDRLFRMNYYMNEIESKDGENADKESEVYDRFTLELRASLDFKLPNSYIMNYKVFNGINKAMISDHYFNNVRYSNRCDVPISFTNSKYIETREFIKPVEKGFKLVTREEFLINNTEETIQLSEFFPNGTIYYAVLERLSVLERRNLFDVHIYENDVLIEDENSIILDIGSDIICTIKNCDTEVSFLIFIYCNIVKLEKLIPLIRERMRKSIFPNVDEFGNPLVVGSMPPIGLDPNKLPVPYWEPDVDYVVDNRVIHQSCLYKALIDNINIEPVEEDNDTWKFLAKFWSEGMEFKAGEYIIFKSMLYLVLKDNTGKIPDIDYDYFKFIRILGINIFDFNMKDIYSEPSIGGKHLSGGKRSGTSGRSHRTLKYFNTGILTMRNLEIF